MSLSIFFQKKNFFSFIKKTVKKSFFNKNSFSGPETLISSLIIGLKKKKINFKINQIDKNTKKILFIDDKKNLKKFIDSSIKIYIGPNIMTMPNDDKIFTSKKISKIIVPSKWVKNKYLRQTNRKIGKIKIWYSGVDQKIWIPNKTVNKKIDYLIYIKFIYNKKIIHKIKDYLKLKNKSFKILNYGTYNREEYLSLLHFSKALIFISQSESQGISNFEAWSCNVPTFIYNPGYWIYKNKKYISNSCPYLSSETGMYFKNFLDFKKKIILFQKKKFSPRSWIKKKGTIDFTTNKIIKILDQ